MAVDCLEELNVSKSLIEYFFYRKSETNLGLDPEKNALDCIWLFDCKSKKGDWFPNIDVETYVKYNTML